MSMLGRLTVKRLYEEITVLRYLKCPDWCAEYLYAETFQYTHPVELNTDIQGALTTES